MKNRIKEILTEKKMSQHDLAAMTGIDQSNISRIANGRYKRIELDTAARIAMALNRSVEYIFPGYFQR